MQQRSAAASITTGHFSNKINAIYYANKRKKKLTRHHSPTGCMMITRQTSCGPSISLQTFFSFFFSETEKIAVLAGFFLLEFIFLEGKAHAPQTWRMSTGLCSRETL